MTGSGFVLWSSPLGAQPEVHLPFLLAPERRVSLVTALLRTSFVRRTPASPSSCH